MTYATGVELLVRGTVQGVGFRPFISRLADEIGLTGDVRNTSKGVVIRLFDCRDAVDGFLRRLEDERPVLARIEQIDRRTISSKAPSGFRILESIERKPETAIAADAAICAECRYELFDPADRRYRYPFLNCTQCGPRYSIIKAIPYDRARTTMGDFSMCKCCQAEYTDPADRRFHAEATACPDCGPTLWLENAGDPTIDHRGEDAIQAALDRLRRGDIIAIKGLGGFHLACPALDQAAVARLRQRKRRARKPFALMVRDRDAAASWVELSPAAIEALESAEAPIVLAPLKPNTPLPLAVAPCLDQVGVMLPYTPLHALLFEQADEPLVMTSGNVSDDPQLIDNEAARRRLADIADAFVMHDRPIANRVDDSLVQTVGDEVQILRRARGHAPRPVPLPPGFPTDHPKVLAMGGDIKNAIASAARGSLTLSPFIGDLVQAETFEDLRRWIDGDLDMVGLKPDIVAIDSHPSYRSSGLGKELAATRQAASVEVLHHHAHAAVCMVEQGVPLDHPPITAIVLDGLGMGESGALWGGEILLADYRICKRIGSLKPAPLLGGDRAALEPWRNLIAQLLVGFGTSDRWPAPLRKILETRPVNLLTDAWCAGLNTPDCTSAGRLFDAVATTLDIVPEHQEYEGEAAMRLQALAASWLSLKARPNGYRFAISEDDDGLSIIDPAPLWQAIAEDLKGATPPGEIAARFHLGLADVFTKIVSNRSTSLSSTVALTGGVCQNALLAGMMHETLAQSGFKVLEARSVPANDGGLAIGQAAIVVARSI
ncbi:MAG: carbamoyltransferase HypF [Geminicoccaceae bacterium]